VNEINIIVPEGFTIDEEKSSFTCIKFKKEKKKEAKCWEDLEDIKGYYVTEGSTIDSANSTSINFNKNIFATKEQAEASIALAMLSQLMKDVNENWIPDWRNSEDKYTLGFFNNKIITDYFQQTHQFLAFPTKTIRELFLKNHEELIIKAKPLL